MDTNLIEQVNDHGNQLGVNDGLHLLLVTCCDVGQEPHCLLQDKSINTRVSDDFLSWEWCAVSQRFSVCLITKQVRAGSEPRGRNRVLTPGWDTVQWAGRGWLWGSNHRPVTKRRPLFLRNWSQMHSDISRDAWSSAPFLHQPMYHTRTHTLLPLIKPLIYATNWRYKVVGVLFGSSSLWFCTF